jgi:glycerol-3-phosphate dehydrogenase
MTPPGSPDLDARRRTRELAELAGGEAVDVLVVGGGVTGAGVALDAASRGLSVALVERRDLASGTSGCSSKLAHGGLRYLLHGELGVAWESARERAILATRTAPHLVRPLPMLVALTGEVPRPLGTGVAAALRAGDLLRAAVPWPRWRVPRTRRVSPLEARRWAPALRPGAIRGALMHWDGQLEDDARLVVALARTAAAHGARVLTHAGALALDGEGADARDELSGERFRIRARHVVNAAGVWAGSLQGSVELRPSRGAHLLVRAGRLGWPRAALSVPAAGERGRFAFALPRPDGLALIGITDEPHDGPLPEVATMNAEEETTLLEQIGEVLQRPLGPADVVGRFVGLRPLLAGEEGRTADLSRRHALVEDPDTGVLAVVGGKLTTYRRMAQDAVDAIAARSGVRAGRCRTRNLPLVGAGALPAGLPEQLVRRYGGEARRVAALAEGRPELLRPVADGVPVLGVELLFAARHELALTVEDAVERRVRAGLVPEWRHELAAAAERLIPELAAPGVAAA